MLNICFGLLIQTLYSCPIQIHFYPQCQGESIDADAEYKPDELARPPFSYIPLEYKARTVALAEAHPKWSLANLHKKGCSRLKRKDHLKIWKDDVKKGGTHFDKWVHIDSETFQRFTEARTSYEQVSFLFYRNVNKQ